MWRANRRTIVVVLNNADRPGRRADDCGKSIAIADRDQHEDAAPDRDSYDPAANGDQHTAHADRRAQDGDRQ